MEIIMLDFKSIFILWIRYASKVVPDLQLEKCYLWKKIHK